MSQQRKNGEKILVARSSTPSYEEYIEMTKPIWDSTWPTNTGDFHKRLEQKLRDYMGINNLMLFVSGHMALEMAIQALSLTGEVITTLLTFVSATHAIVRNGFIPISCDINLLDCTTGVEQIEFLITNKTSATIPVHVCGNICDMERINATAKKHGLKMIYDAAHTFGERCRGKSVAEFRDASTFSFHVIKAFNTIEGNAVSLTEEWTDRRLNCLKNCGIVDQDHVVWVGGDAKMNEFQAAMGLYNLRHLDNKIEKRKVVTKRYHKNLGDAPGLKLPAYREELTPNYAYFPVAFDGFKADRNEVYDCLAKHNIFPRKHFYPLTNGFQCYSNRFPPEDTPVAAYMANRVLTLPLYAGPSLEQVDRTRRVMKNI